MSDWPAPHEYTIAVQNPQVCFRDPELKSASVQRTASIGMPKVWTGNFAQVYELRSETSRWAVKCFTRSVHDIRTRYSSIAAAISRSKLPYFVDFDFLDYEMLVDGARWPVLKMRWSDGQPLAQFVESNLARPRALLATAAQLFDLVRDLERQRMAHGDLQHGNILIAESSLKIIKLVDYDGMFVPAFAGTDAPEGGLPAYQHPRRSPGDYGVGLDRFSALVIGTALCALSVDPSLWTEFNTGDNLLFTREDFTDPEASKLIGRLRTLADPQLLALVEHLANACSKRPLDVSLPDHPLSLKPVARHGFWWVPPSGAEVQPAPAQSPTPTRIRMERMAVGWQAVTAAVRARLNRKYRIRIVKG
jgi:hypothetical protein